MRAGGRGAAGGCAPGCHVKRLAYHALPRGSGVQPAATSPDSSRLTASVSACTDRGPAGGQSSTPARRRARSRPSAPSTGRAHHAELRAAVDEVPFDRGGPGPVGLRRLGPARAAAWRRRAPDRAPARARSRRRSAPTGAAPPERTGDLERDRRRARGRAGARGRRSESTQPATPPPSSARLISSAACSVPSDAAGRVLHRLCGLGPRTRPPRRAATRADTCPTGARRCAGRRRPPARAPAARQRPARAMTIAHHDPCPPGSVPSGGHPLHHISRLWRSALDLARARTDSASVVARGTAGRRCPRRPR